MRKRILYIGYGHLIAVFYKITEFVLITMDLTHRYMS